MINMTMMGPSTPVGLAARILPRSMLVTRTPGMGWKHLCWIPCIPMKIKAIARQVLVRLEDPWPRPKE